MAPKVLCNSTLVHFSTLISWCFYMHGAASELDIPILAVLSTLPPFPLSMALRFKTSRGDPSTELSLCHVSHPLEGLPLDFVHTCITKLIFLCYEYLATSLSFQ